MSNLFSTGGAGNVGFSGEVQQSLKFNDDESQYLSWTPAATGNRKTWTWSGWVKRGNLGTVFLFGASGTTTAGTGTLGYIYIDNDTLVVGADNTSGLKLQTNAVLRDTASWYHIVVAFDTTQLTSTNRVKVYINGVLQTSFSSSVYPTQDRELNINANSLHTIGRWPLSNDFFLDGYLSNIHFIDGQALDPTSFGQFTNGYWEKIDYAGTYGTNGFHLTFEDDVVSEGFNVTTYRGTGANQSISGLGFSPDFVWGKARNHGYSHWLYDSVRGAEKVLRSDLTSAEATQSQGLTAFNADGFSLGTTDDHNENTKTYVAWAWDAGSGSPVSNTDGTITSTVKANPDYGFSITSYTGNGTSGATVGHGLGVTPDMVIVKNRTTSGTNWPVFHSSQGTGSNGYLDITNSWASGSTWGSSQTFNSTVFSVGSQNYVNNSGDNMIAYCFSSVAGYSKISSYTGTGAAGNAVTCGFRPAFVMIKRSNNTGNWVIWDTTRLPQSGTIQGSYLSANSSDAEESPSGSNDIEFTDTGFTLQDSGIYSNSSGDTFIYMAFADTREAAFWKDVSGQGNHWTPNNLDYRDSLPDSPANNWATFNPLVRRSDVTTLPTFSEGNLKAVFPDAGGNVTYAAGTIPITSGKWYYETRIDSLTTNNVVVGWCTEDEIAGTSSHVMISSSTGGIFIDGSLQSTEGALSVGDIIGTTIDLDNGYVGFYKNGTALSVSPSISITSASWWNSGKFLFAWNRGSTSDGTSANFGQDSTFAGAKPMGSYTDDNSIGNFQYAPPAGYLALCSANLPIPTIIDGSEYFNTVLYTGNGTTNNITGVGFQPDFVWAKGRNAVRDHILLDVIRGTTKMLSSNLTAAEVTGTDFASFDADGFTLNAVDTTGGLNASGGTFASWNWKAGGTAVSNTAGTITSQVSANVDAGFSIVSYTGTGSGGATVGHSLGVKPDMVIAKNRTDATNWLVWHKDLSGEDYYLHLERTDAQAQNSAFWSAFSSTTFTLGNSNHINGSGDAIIAYCFANSGTTKAGSYTGNGSTDGTFVYTGFRPAWVMVKWSNGSQDWTLFDNKRPGFNETDKYLHPSSSAAEGDYDTLEVDLLSNGFKCRGPYNHINTSGGSYIYLAFAEHPFKYSNAR